MKQKTKGAGAATKRAPAAHSRRKSKSAPLRGFKDPVKRVIPQVAKPPTIIPPAERPTEKRVEELPSILDSQLRFFESMYRFTPLGYFMRMQRLVREGGRPHLLQSIPFLDMTKAGPLALFN